MSIPEKVSSELSALLFRELLLSQGCTEPAAIAYAGALCTEQLGTFPEHVRLSCSGSLFKNAKSAIIPNTGHLKGLAAAVISGIVGGRSSLQLEVLDSITPAHWPEIRRLLNSDFCEVLLMDSNDNLHILVEAFSGLQNASVEICRGHTHVSRITKNGRIVFESNLDSYISESQISEDILTPKYICAFADSADLSGALGALLQSQLTSNVAICEEGMKNNWGAGIGKLMLSESSSLEHLACAFAAAGSDARMSGCAMPVVINSGSGNQGITLTAPVYIYARELKAGHDRLLRALIVSNLMAIYQKHLIGNLSAYCGAVSAGSAAGAAITYLKGGTPEQVALTFANATACISGILCDGAKPSCAAKIACSVQMGILAHKMALSGKNLLPGDGIVGKTPDETVQSVGYLAREGMRKIDRLILKVMYSSVSEQ